MFGPLLNGLKITLKHMVTPGVTVKYPYEYRQVAERYRGRHILKVDEIDMWAISILSAKCNLTFVLSFYLCYLVTIDSPMNTCLK